MRKLRLGIIGCGEITRFMSVFAKLNKNIQVVGFYARNIEKARRYASYFRNASAYDDYVEMARNLQMDAVYIALPHHLHFPVMQEYITRGIHVLCEKPAARHFTEANEALNLARECKVKIGVNYQYRYDKACYRMAKASRNGDLGKLHYGICNIPWSRSNEYFQKSQWHAQWEKSGGGTLITHGSHGLDLLLWSFGLTPVQAAGFSSQQKFFHTEVEDLCMGILELENGSLLQVTSSMVAMPEQPAMVKIYGSKGTAICTFRELFSSVNFIKTSVPNYTPEVRGVHAMGRSLEAFRQWVVKGKPYYCSLENVAGVLASIEAIYESSHSQVKTEVRKGDFDNYGGEIL